ncbi:MAG: NlpC/P60 family protein [Candidatus Zixiibacteriota bacterium]
MMKKYSILLFAFIALSCVPNPRYKSGGSETPRQIVATTGLSTNDYVRLGNIIQSYIGKPYKGTSKYAAGIDCSLFARDVYNRFNDSNLPRTVEEQLTVGHEVPLRVLRYGDLVFFEMKPRRITHVGIYVGFGEFVHASESNGVMISRLKDKYWMQRFATARRVLE